MAELTIGRQEFWKVWERKQPEPYGRRDAKP